MHQFNTFLFFCPKRHDIFPSAFLQTNQLVVNSASSAYGCVCVHIQVYVFACVRLSALSPLFANMNGPQGHIDMLHKLPGCHMSSELANESPSSPGGPGVVLAAAEGEGPAARL